MYGLKKKIGQVFTSKFVGTEPSSYEKRIYRATVSQRLRNTVVDYGSRVCFLGDIAAASSTNQTSHLRPQLCTHFSVHRNGLLINVIKHSSNVRTYFLRLFSRILSTAFRRGKTLASEHAVDWLTSRTH